MAIELTTALLTVTVGVVVFTLGQLISRFVIDPMAEQRRHIGEIGDALIFYADVCANPLQDLTSRQVMVPPPRYEEAGVALRRLGSQLMAKSNAIPLYRLLAFLRFVRSWHSILEARRGLTFLSNSLVRGDGVENDKTRQRVLSSLHIRVD